MSKINGVLSMFLKAGDRFAKDRSTRLAAALAYYTMFAMAPMLIIVTGIVTQLLNRIITADVIASFLDQIGTTEDLLAGDELLPFFEGVIGPEATSWLQSIIDGATAPSSLTVAAIISIIIMFWGASNLFHHLKETLNIIWGVRAAPGAGIWVFVRGRLLAFAAVVGMGMLFIVFLLLNTLVASAVTIVEEVFPESQVVIETWRIIQFLQFALVFLVMTLIFALVFKFLPDVQIAWKDVWVGSLVTSLLFVIGTIGLAIYFQLTSVGSLYGAAGSIMVVLIWFYYSSQIFLYGAEFAQVYSNRYGSEILPAEHAVVYVEKILEEPSTEVASVEADQAEEAAGTIFRAPAWFMKMTGRIDALFTPKEKPDSSDKETAGKQ